MTSAGPPLEALLQDLWLDLDELVRAAGVDAAWARRRADEGLLAPQVPGPGETWRFDAATVRRVRCMARIERDFDAVPELAALVADLEDEIAQLRTRLAKLDPNR